MTRLYFMPDPATRFVAEVDGEDAPIIGVGARHGHPDGTYVTAVDFGAHTYRITDDVHVSEFRFPLRWFDLDDDPAAPALIVHDCGAVTRVPFVPVDEAPP